MKRIVKLLAATVLAPLLTLLWSGTAEAQTAATPDGTSQARPRTATDPQAGTAGSAAAPDETGVTPPGGADPAAPPELDAPPPAGETEGTGSAVRDEAGTDDAEDAGAVPQADEEEPAGADAASEGTGSAARATDETGAVTERGAGSGAGAGAGDTLSEPAEPDPGAAGTGTATDRSAEEAAGPAAAGSDPAAPAPPPTRPGESTPPDATTR